DAPLQLLTPGAVPFAHAAIVATELSLNRAAPEPRRWRALNNDQQLRLMAAGSPSSRWPGGDSHHRIGSRVPKRRARTPSPSTNLAIRPCGPTAQPSPLGVKPALL